MPTPLTAQAVTATPATPTLAERLERLAAEIERNRIDLHVPGAVLAIVRGEEVIFQVERVEVNVELPPDTFTLEPSTSPGSGR